MSEIKKLENISHLKLAFVQFRKHFKGPSFSGGWVKLLKTFTRQFFRWSLSKTCIGKFTDIFVCLLLS